MRLLMGTAFGLGLITAAFADDSNWSFPKGQWEKVKPESRHYSSERLEVLRSWLKTQNTTAMQVSVRGRVIFEYDDVKLVSKIFSARKSVLAMLFGKYYAAGKIDLNQTVEQMGLTDEQPFLPIEKVATLQHLLTSRSGIYLPTANQGLTNVAPRRGSQPPGTYFQYQNWDFNAAGTAFEKLTSKDIFAALEEDLAKPIGMQDFNRTQQRKNSEMPISRHPEYAMYLSTRDMARLGLLMLADGQWDGRSVMPKGWAGRITTLVTHFNELHPADLGAYETQIGHWGYGMLWWVWDAPSWPGVVTGPYQGAYSMIGAFGQYVTVLPAADLVIAHKVDTDDRGARSLNSSQYHTILQMVIETYCGDQCK